MLCRETMLLSLRVCSRNEGTLSLPPDVFSRRIGQESWTTKTLEPTVRREGNPEKKRARVTLPRERCYHTTASARNTDTRHKHTTVHKPPHTGTSPVPGRRFGSDPSNFRGAPKPSQGRVAASTPDALPLRSLLLPLFPIILILSTTKNSAFSNCSLTADVDVRETHPRDVNLICDRSPSPCDRLAISPLTAHMSIVEVVVAEEIIRRSRAI